MIDLASRFAKCRIFVWLLTNTRLGLHNPSGENREPLLDKHEASDQITFLHCCLWVISLVQRKKPLKESQKQVQAT